VHDPEEVAGLRALDDAVVIGGREREDLGDAEARERVLGRALELGRVLHGADADDGSLSGHEARHRVDGADRSRVRERDRGPGEVVRGELAGAGAADHVLVGHPEGREVHPLGTLDGRDQELSRAIRPGQVDRQPEVHVRRAHDRRLAVHLAVRGVHRGEVGERLDHGEADEVREGDLAAAAAGEVVVDHDPVVHEQLRGHRPDARRRRDLEAGLHVGHHPSRRAAQGGDVVGAARVAGIQRRRGGRVPRGGGLRPHVLADGG